MRQKKAWVKLSGAYIRSKVGEPSYADRTVIARAFIKAAPDQGLVKKILVDNPARLYGF